MFGRRKINEQVLNESLNKIAGQIIDSVSEVVLEERNAEIELAREDRGWQKLSTGSGLDATSAERESVITQARIYARKDPLARKTIRIWNDYSIGSGLNKTIEDDRIAKVINNYWDHPDNRTMHSITGQRKSSSRLLVDGELMLAVFEQNGIVVTRRLDPLQIVDVVFDSDDNETPLFYKRRWWVGGKEKRAMYRDFRNTTVAELVPQVGEQVFEIDKSFTILHVPFEPLGFRGNSLLATSLDWIKSHRKFMRSRVAWAMAKAEYATKMKVKGGQKAVDDIVNTLKSTLMSSDEEDNPPPAPASTHVENYGAEMTPLKYDTGSQDARNDAAMFLQMAGVGASIYPHYFGAGEAFRLATASAMELPMLKAFESYQNLWLGVHKELFDFVLRCNGIKEPEAVELSYPEIVRKDIAAQLGAISQILTASPEVAMMDEVQKQILKLIGIRNVDEVMKQFKEGAGAGVNEGVKQIKKLTEIKEKLMTQIVESVRNA